MTNEKPRQPKWQKRIYSYLNSIKTKLVISFLVITLTPLMYISYAMLQNASDGLLNVIVNNSLAHARKASIDLNRFVAHQFEIAQLLVKSESALNMETDKLMFMAGEHDRRYVSIEKITIFKADGSIAGASNESPGRLKIDVEKALNMLKEREYLLLPASSKSSSPALVTGLYDRSGSQYGLIAVELNLLQLKSVLSENLVGNTTRFLLLDETGKVVFSTREKDAQADVLLLQKQVASRDHGVFAVETAGLQKPLLASLLPVVGLGWRVLLIQEQQEVYWLVETFRTNLYWILFFTVITAVVIALLISQNIALPILQVTRGANELASGKYDVRINVTNTDEVGQLASNFNYMADSLAEKMAELRVAYDDLKTHSRTIEEKNIELDRKVFEVGVLYKIGKTMVEVGLDLERLLDVIIDKAIEAAHAKRGSLMLIDDNQEALELQRVRIWDEEKQSPVPLTEFSTDISIKPGEGIAGKVLQSGAMMVINDPDNHPDFKQYDVEKNRVEQLVCVPLKVKNATLGVINIVNRKDGKCFSPEDTDLLQTMANQAALVLDNTKLFKLAITDGLTGLYMVRHFRNKLSEEIKRARRYNNIFSIVFFDIDHFKKFNDTYGHQVGDEVLKQVARIFRGSLRDDVDMAARYGGEEMIALLPETDAAGAFVVAERLRTAIETHEFTGYEKPLHVTISIGISEFPLHDAESLALIRKADTALYACKGRGRNQTAIYSDDMGVVSEK